MGNASGGMEVSPRREVKGALGGLKQPPGPKLPLPSEEELEERFSSVLVSTRQHVYLVVSMTITTFKKKEMTNLTRKPNGKLNAS